MSKRKQVILLVLLSLPLFFLRLGSTSVYQVAEARNAECAREMLARHDWVVPVFNGGLRTDKPALEYYAMIAAYVAGGVSEGSARFFSALCGVLLVLFTFLTAYRHFGKEAAWWSALALLASIHTVVQFRLATPDPYLVLFHTLALYAFLEGWYSGKWRWWGGMYGLLGLAVFAKGPVGLLLPGLGIFLFLLFRRSFNWKTIARLRPWWGLLLVLAFCAPWYVLVHIRTGGAWTRGFFLRHNIDRFSDATGGHGGIFFLTFLFVLVGMLPFSVFIVRIMRHTWKRIRENDVLLFSFLSFWCVVAFYAVSRTKLINYTVPCYPFLAIMTGHYLAHITGQRLSFKSLKPELIALLVVTIAIPAGIYYWTQSNPELPHLGWIAWFFIPFPLGAGWAFYLYSRQQLRKSLFTVAGAFMLGTLIVFAYPYARMDAETPMRKAASLLNTGRPVVVYKRFNDAFVFYNRRPIPVMEDTAALRDYLLAHPAALVISDVRDQSPLESIKGLKPVRRDREIFNSHTSIIYDYQYDRDNNIKNNFK